MRNNELIPETNHFKDIYGYYAIFAYDLSITPHYSDAKGCYKTQGTKYHEKALLYHQDNNQDKIDEEKFNAAQQYRETQENMYKLREAHNCFKEVNAEE